MPTLQAKLATATAAMKTQFGVMHATQSSEVELKAAIADVTARLALDQKQLRTRTDTARANSARLRELTLSEQASQAKRDHLNAELKV